MTHNATEEQAISRNPATGEIIGRYPFDPDAALHAALTRTASAGRVWRATSVARRAHGLRQLAQQLRAASEELVRTMTAEMGKPIKQARAEVEKCALLCEWYAEHGPGFLEPVPSAVPNGSARQEYRPLGAVLAVMPWNFPVWQVLRGAAAMLLAGNTYVLKHAPNVMGCAYQLRDIFARTDILPGVFEVINIEPRRVAGVIEDDRIAAVAVTGSVRAGSAIARIAGGALKKCVLELGGSDPFIVLADGDIEQAVRSATLGRFQNTGQVCVAAKRFIIEASIAGEFEACLVDAVQSLSIGDPTRESTFIGPMARYDLRDELHDQVRRSLAEGARLLVGGDRLTGEGNFYAPTVLTNVVPGMTAFREELFGPVAAIIEAEDAGHAIELANDSEFGLGGTIWTRDVERANELAGRLETGGVFINGDFATDPRVAVGGVKKSGYGRELSSFGVHEFCNIQTVWVDRR